MKTGNILKYITILILFMRTFSACGLVYAQTWAQTQNQIKENTQQIENINGRLSDLKDNYHLLYDGAKNQNEQLSNQISFAGYLLGAFSFIFTILGFFLAWYINRQSEKVKKMKDMVEATKEAIDGHSADLYKKLKREETLSLLERLREVPEDVTNICELLLSRELLDTDLACLKESYLKIKSGTHSDTDVKNSYMVLFMQHFPYEALRDHDLKDEIILNIEEEYLNVMFPRDVRNFFEQVLKYIEEFGVDDEKNKTIIKKLFYNYSKSKFKNNNEIQFHIKETLSKNNIRTSSIASILKEKDPKDDVYIAWVDLIFT